LSPVPFVAQRQPSSSLKVIPERTDIERRMMQDVLSYFNKENRLAIAAAKRGDYYQTDNDALRKVLQPHIEQGAMLGVEQGLEPLIAFGLGFDETLANEAAVAFARMHSAELVHGINNTTRGAIRNHVGDWLQSGDKIDELIRLLEPTFGASRADMIAVTEITNAIAGANVASWRQVNRDLGTELVTGMQWTTANDERTCPICSALGGLTYSDDGAVPASIEQQDSRGVTTSLSGSFVHPGGVGLQSGFAGRSYPRPPAHHRCRCMLVPIVGRNSGIGDRDNKPNPDNPTISQHIRLTGSTREKKIWRESMDAIDSVHSFRKPLFDSPGYIKQNSVDIIGKKNIPTEGRYLWRKKEIHLYHDGNTKGFTTLHEIGHWIDHLGLPGKGFATQNQVYETLDGWRKVVHESKSYKALLAKRQSIVASGKSTKYVDYLLRDQELFARSYAQYITTQSNSASLKYELGLDFYDDVWGGLRQWPDEDFKEIANEFKKMFLDLGWTI